MDTLTTVLDIIKTRLAVAPRFVKRHSPPDLTKSQRYQLATDDKNNACIVYGTALATHLYHAANDLEYLIGALEATERNAAELRKLLDQTRDEWTGATTRARIAEAEAAHAVARARAVEAEVMHLQAMLRMSLAHFQAVNGRQIEMPGGGFTTIDADYEVEAIARALEMSRIRTTDELPLDEGSV